VISVLDRLGAREQTAVDRVHDRSSSDHPSVKVAAVQALDGVLSARDLVELEINVALRVGVERDVHNVAVLLLGLEADFVLELLGPVLTHLPVTVLASLLSDWERIKRTQRDQTCYGEPRSDSPC